KGFNPIIYPDLTFHYTVNVKAEGASVRITVDLAEALPDEWIGKVGFNLELFPGDLFGKTYFMDDGAGIFPRQLNGPMVRDETGSFQIKPLAEGMRLVIAPESEAQRMTITTVKGQLQLLDGRAHHNNGWFIVRTPIPAGATKSAVEWIVVPNALPGWKYEPVIHLSQVGYHPQQQKVAVIECDRQHKASHRVLLKRILPNGELKTTLAAKSKVWGDFLRYQYLLFDFSEVREPGMYLVTYGDRQSQPFKIGKDIFDRHVWQPTLEYFLPVQMCHVRVNDRYRVWHGACHLDDALMAPVDTLHFDGYRQGPSTLTRFKPYEHVPGLNVGGWHDAGDYDLRVESQAETVRILSLIYENFHVDYDETTIDQQNRLVELHRPDGKPDILQQIEHGVLSILGGYHHLGRLYRGIICSHLRQYVTLGDGSTMTDNRFYNANLGENESTKDESGKFDDRWVFTEENPDRELLVAGCLAAASRALKDYNNHLSDECLRVAQELWESTREVEGAFLSKIEALTELILATNKLSYKDQFIKLLPAIQKNMNRSGWLAARLLPVMDDRFRQSVSSGIQSYAEQLEKDLSENPFGVPYRPNIWGAGWDIQEFGVRQFYLHRAWPELFPEENVFNALNFVLGCHPGLNTASFASGVGAKSMTVAYGFNRADWSYIPGGVVSGTGLVRPDFPELKEWPFLWQQAEYVIGGGAENFMFLVLATRQLLDHN
ncbi:MAG: glycoside hydrolase family 9 protein, partial [candidate division KSB1 bacterium]|nr:glycoside hydrolase family 9 protein [candidate division KSB1 bacterium]